ncbi:MAG: DNA polymerase III subunit delta, partial [Pseudomonadota bacterium]
MKLKPAEIARFLSKPDPAVFIFLLYGPNNGLVTERAHVLCQNFCEDLSDPFLASELTSPAIKADPALLASEVSSQSLMGGERLVRVRDADDTITKGVENTLECAQAGKVVLYAGDLAPRSALRKLCEKEARCAAIACYAEEGAALGRLLEGALQEQNITIDPDAVQYLQTQLGQDRGQVRRNLEKLIVFLGHETHVTFALASQVIAPSGQGRIDDLLAQAFIGDMGPLDRSIQQFF